MTKSFENPVEISLAASVLSAIHELGPTAAAKIPKWRSELRDSYIL